MCGNYNKLLHKQILIRKDTKSKMDEFKKEFGLNSYNAVINFLIDKCQCQLEPIETQQAPSVH